MGLQDFLKGAHQKYSGRGMYGKQCPGFVYGSTGEAINDLIDAATDADIDDGTKAKLKDSRFDDMGRGVILYFPNAESEEPYDTDEDDDGYD